MNVVKAICLSCLSATAWADSTPALNITKTHSGKLFRGLNQATFTIVVSNKAGAGPTSGAVIVTESPSNGLTIASMSGKGWTCSTASCTRSDVLNGGEIYPPITVLANVGISAPDLVTNQVSLNGGGSAPASASDQATAEPAPTTSLPDMVLKDFTASITSGSPPTIMNLRMTVFNQGSIQPGPFRVGFYLAKTPDVRSSDIFTNSFCSLPAFAPFVLGYICTFPGTISVSSTLAPGTYYLAAIADDLNQVAESDETNNVKLFDAGVVTVPVPPPPPPPPGPSIQSAGGVVNGASFQSSLASGTWMTIRGNNLSATTRIWTGQDFAGANMPTSLDGVSVSINSKPAYVYYISPTQLNVLAPGDAALGPVNVQVANANGSSNIVSANKQAFAPALFAFSPQNSRYAAANVGATFIGPAGLFGAATTTRPAAPKEFISFYATGLGATTPPYPEGQILPAYLNLAFPLNVFIGNVLAPIQFSGLVSPGLFQINVQVPAVPDGDATVVLEIGGTKSPATVYIPVKK